MKIYNTLTRKKEKIKPLKENRINLFVCGPTVYDFPHLGHARTYITFDCFVKFLRFKKFKVFYLQNITDIDDKIIKKANKENKTIKNIAVKYESEYLKSMKQLKVNSVNKYARATKHIKEIISQVKRLVDKGFAYATNDGVYFDIAKFKNYGKLSKRKDFQDSDQISRIDESKFKRHKGDFALWKISKKGEPHWNSPFGKGRPGWHIEDTAITEKYFGPQYDIHGGGIDLIFPHHEAEIAQMEALSGKSPFVKYWMHIGFLNIKGEKMSKSLGNFITINDFTKKHGARLLRYFIIKNHYRYPIEFKDSSIYQAKKELMKIDEFISRLKKVKLNSSNSYGKYIVSFEKRFIKAIEEDFNVPEGLGYMFDFINKTNKVLDQGNISKQESLVIIKKFKEFDSFLDFIFWKENAIPKSVIKLVEEREKLRKLKQWEKSDEIRNKIKKLGYIIQDTKSGPIIKKSI